jgi:hypothetical protein
MCPRVALADCLATSGKPWTDQRNAGNVQVGPIAAEHSLPAWWLVGVPEKGTRPIAERLLISIMKTIAVHASSDSIPQLYTPGVGFAVAARVTPYFYPVEEFGVVESRVDSSLTRIGNEEEPSPPGSSI